MALVGALVRGGGSALARNIMGRKKKVKASVVAPKQKVVGQEQKRASAIVKSPTAGVAKAMAPIKQVPTGSVAKDDYLTIISKKLLVIEQVVLSVYQAELNNLKQKKKDEQDDARKEKENKLETKPTKPEKKKPKLADLPKLGVFGWLKRFIGNVIAGIFLSKMVDFIDFLPRIVSIINNVGNFIADFGVALVNGLVTFVDFGIKAYDFTLGAISDLTGNLFGEHADKIIGLLDTAFFLSTAITLSMAGEALMGDGGGPGGPGGSGRRTPGVTQGRGGQRVRPRFPGTGPTVTQGRGGQGPGPRFPGTGPRITGTNAARGAGIFKRIKDFIKPIPFLGTLLTIVFGKMEYDDRKAAGQTNVQAAAGTGGGILGSIIAMATAAALIPEPTSTVGGLAVLGLIGLLGMGGSAIGSAAADKATGAKYQEGGLVESDSEPEIKEGNERKIKPVKPTREYLPEDPDADEFDERTTKLGNLLGTNDFFGPILRVTSKALLDEEVTSRDYENIGRGINLLIDEGISKGRITSNEDSKLVKIPFLNTTKWVQSTFQSELSSELKDNMTISPIPKPKTGSKDEQKNGDTTETVVEPQPIGPAPAAPATTAEPSDSSELKVGKASEPVGPAPAPPNAEKEAIAGALGDYMKANRSTIGVTGQIHQWLPRHPAKAVRSSYPSYHNVNRALDIGGWSPSSPAGGGADEQAPVIKALIDWNKRNGYEPVQLIHGSPAYKNYGDYRVYPDVHHHHVHVAYKEGGPTLGKPHLAMIGEEGKEFVIDADSYEALRQVAPGLAMALNQASNKTGVANALRQYASYEQGAEQIVMMPQPTPQQSQQESYGGSSGGTIILPPPMDTSNPFEFLEYQG
jgi:hypothetical protein